MYFRIIHYGILVVAIIVAGISVFISLLAICDLLLNIGWGYRWYTLVSSLVILAVAVIIAKLARRALL